MITLLQITAEPKASSKARTLICSKKFQQKNMKKMLDGCQVEQERKTLYKKRSLISHSLFVNSQFIAQIETCDIGPTTYSKCDHFKFHIMKLSH